MFSVRESIAHRNFLSQEYYHYKIALNEKKAKALSADVKMEPDQKLVQFNDFSIQQILNNEEIYKRFIYTSVWLSGDSVVAKVCWRLRFMQQNRLRRSDQVRKVLCEINHPKLEGMEFESQRFDIEKALQLGRYAG